MAGQVGATALLAPAARYLSLLTLGLVRSKALVSSSLTLPILVGLLRKELAPPSEVCAIIWSSSVISVGSRPFAGKLTNTPFL